MEQYKLINYRATLKIQEKRGLQTKYWMDIIRTYKNQVLRYQEKYQKLLVSKLVKLMGENAMLIFSKGVFLNNNKPTTTIGKSITRKL